MTGINLNVQNSYAALYSTSLTATDNTTHNITNGTTSEVTSTIGRGEKLTLSAEARALSQQSFKPTDTPPATTLGVGFGVRPPAVKQSDDSADIRPPEAPKEPAVGGDTVIPPALTP
jgi:hypothetical protein